MAKVFEVRTTLHLLCWGHFWINTHGVIYHTYTYANHRQIQAYANTGRNRQIQIHKRTLLFRYELFINFWLWFFTRRETQFLKVFRNQTMLIPKTSNSQDHLFRERSHPHSSHFSVWVLLWPWWLSYPLRTSVQLHPMTMLWTKRLE